jgi:putative methanogenesis marker protein 8
LSKPFNCTSTVFLSIRNEGDLVAHRLEETCSNVCGLHEIYCCGSLVRISGGEPRVLTEPLIESCPLHEALYGTMKIDAQTVQDTVEKKIAQFGFCCRNRCFSADRAVAYGASEMMSAWLEKRLIDCAVTVCDGAGTVMTSNPKLVQGIGARLTGILKTSPIRETIKHIENSGGVVLDKVNARIDQFDGVKRAFNTGFKHVAVSVAGFQAKATSEIRDLEHIQEAEALVFSVCNTRITERDVKHIAKADLVCASASTILRKEIGRNALLQLGVTIPVYALTQKGKDLALAYLSTFKDRIAAFRTSQLPYEVRDKGPKLKTL